MLKPAGIANVATDELTSGRHGRPVTMTQVVVNHQVVSATCQFLRHDAPDISSPAGDKNSHRFVAWEKV
jgi:hypothetical protein